MGAAASKHPPCTIITLDALGTLYRFKEPFPVQYTKIARQCGLKAEFSTSDLERSFRRAFKTQNTLYPNYGKKKLSSPQVWWEKLVVDSFKPVIGDAELPPDIGSKLYNHFSSGSAYELFPDVQPFVESLNKLKRDHFSDPTGPMLITGVISNSDPRVRQVLNSLGLRTGPSQHIEVSWSEVMEDANKQNAQMSTSGEGPIKTMYRDFYNSQNDFDFLTTSYEAGAEKPAPEIFLRARALAIAIPLSRYEQTLESESVLGNAANVIKGLFASRAQVKGARWIHIGDDLEKDYRAAKAFGIEALYLARDDEGSSKNAEDIQSATSLEEAAAVVSLVAQEHMSR